MTNSINISTFEDTQKTKGYIVALQETYDQLGPDEFISFVLKQRNKGKSKKKFRIADNGEFWNEFLSDYTLLRILFRSKNGEDLFYWYLSNSEFVSRHLLDMLSKIDPEKLISLVRYSKLFLRDGGTEIIQGLSLPKEYNNNHQETWLYISRKDVELWSKINFNSWKEFPASQFLGNLINWLETKRFDDDSLMNLEQLAQSYNFIISLFLSENYERCKNLSSQELNDIFHASMQHPSPILNESFNTVLEWKYFESAVITPYCFDQNIIPVLESESLRFEYIDEAEYRNWQINGERYFKNKERYFRLGAEEVQNAIDRGLHIPEGRYDGDQAINLELCIKSTSAKLLLHDLHLDKIRINNGVFSTFDFINPLMGYSVNRQVRYETQLSDFSKESNSWQWAFYQLNEKCRVLDVDCDPYLMLKEKEYVDHNSQACNPDQAPIFEELIHNFGYRITEKFVFNRHKIGYDVWYKPFIRIQDYIFCPMMFFANNEWFYSFAQIVLKNYQIGRNVDLRKESANKMEEHLLQLFQKCNKDWKCLIPKFKHEGDIDLIIHDNADTLIIQLKRTAFRTDLEQTYFESVQSDQKAAYQLNKGEAYLNTNPDVHKLRKENKKYIVSTSFENIGNNIDNCLKVNYLELIWLLENRQFGSLQQLDEVLKRDEILAV